MKECFSHPNYLLRQHLIDVSNSCEKVFDSKQINLSYYNINPFIFKNCLKLTGLLHDSGKYSPYFQIYIQNNENEVYDKTILENYKKKKSLKNHALLSGIILYTVLDKYLQNIDVKIKNKLLYFCTTAVILHHSNLKNKDYFNKYDLDIISDLKHICSLMDFNELYDLIKDYNIFKDVKDFKEEVMFKLKEIKNKIYQNRGILPVGEDLLSYFTSLSKSNVKSLFAPELSRDDFALLILIYSVLIYADKYGAIFKKNIKEGEYINFSNFVDNYKIIKNFTYDTELNRQRQETYLKVEQSLDNIDFEKNKLFSLSLNTGYGKTLNSLNFAFKLRHKLYEKTRIQYKIIYCMPFTSIIEQNFNVVKEVLEKNLNKKVNEEILLKHHHLSKKEYKTEEQEYNISESKFLIETWDSQIIFTTFVQFFETIFSNKNNMMVKLPNMINSIIILDEIQSLNPELYFAFQSVSEVLSKVFNIYIVSCSATQPYLKNTFETNLLENYMDYYNTGRTQMIFPEDFFMKHSYKNSISIEEFFDKVKTIVEEEKVINNKNLLIVMNTKREALKTYNYIKEHYATNSEIFLLSNTLIPLHKEEKIKEITEKMKNKNLIVISTQLIEAGVDLDFDIGIRNYAPLPSLIQCAGRLNRNFKFNNNYGKLYVFNVNNSCDKVYEQTNLLDYTFNSIKNIIGNNILLEKDYIKANDIYFKLINSYFAQNKQIVDNLTQCNFNEFKLIEEKYQSIPVYIQYNEIAIEYWEKFIKLPHEPIERKIEFERIKSVFSKYIVQESIYSIKKIMQPYMGNLTLEHGYLLIDNDFCSEINESNKLYSKETGLNIELNTESK